MPIVSEKSEGSRRVPRRWLGGCGVFLGLLLLLPLVPLVTPVRLHVGDRWLWAYAAFGPPPVEVGTPSLFYRFDDQHWNAHTMFPTVTARDLHIRGFHVGRWHYEVTWFRGYEVGGG